MQKRGTALAVGVNSTQSVVFVLVLIEGLEFSKELSDHTLRLDPVRLRRSKIQAKP
jgi:hypothetical protein